MSNLQLDKEITNLGRYRHMPSDRRAVLSPPRARKFLLRELSLPLEVLRLPMLQESQVKICVLAQHPKR